jgi:hypothetical protein
MSIKKTFQKRNNILCTYDESNWFGPTGNSHTLLLLGKRILSVMQTSHDEDSCEYSVDDFSSQCDQLESIHEESESNTTRKCSSSDIEILVDEYSVDDNFDSPKKEDQDNSTDEAEHATPPVSDNSTQSRVYPSEGHCHSHAQTAKEEHEDEYIGDIDVTPLEANTTLVRSDVKLICQEGTISDATLVCPDAESNDQEEIARTLSKVSLHHDHMPNTKRTVSLVPRCAYAETKSMKYKKEGGLQSAEQKSAKVSCYSLERLTELSKPVEHRSYHSDNENDHKTTIKPKKTSLDSSESRSSFLERMESKEEERREKLQLAIARAVYDAKVDKVILCAIIDSPRSAHALIHMSSHPWRMFALTVGIHNRSRK